MRFQIKHLLVTVAGVTILLSVALVMFYPIIQLSRDINATQNRIINEFDHGSIRDAAIVLLSDPTDRYLDLPDLPEPIARTAPKSVHVTNGTIRIEYGGGFAHYGLIIDPNDRQAGNLANMINGVYYDEQKLMKNVYFYETE